jgi:hypothetical protein
MKLGYAPANEKQFIHSRTHSNDPTCGNVMGKQIASEVLSAADQTLLDKIKVAVTTANAAEKAAETAKAELVSRLRVVGELLLEAKKRHPRVADFEAFLKHVDGLGLSRAYDAMRPAGGRTTDEQLRQETRDRVRKHREKKRLPQPESKSISVTHPDVTETPEMAALDLADDQRAAKASAHYLAEFKIACRTYLPKITSVADQLQAVTFVQLTLKRLTAEARRRAA